MQRSMRIEIGAKTIIFTSVFIVLLFLLWSLKDLVFSLFIAFIITSAVKPLVKKLELLRIPRGISVFVILIFLVVGLGYLISWILPLLVSETNLFVRSLPSMIEDINPSLTSFIQLNSLSQYIPNLTNQVFAFVRNIFSNALFVITTLFFSMHFMLEEQFLEKLLVRFVPEQQAKHVVEVVEKIEKRLSVWFWGELALMTIVGTMTYIGLTLIGVRYALPLSIIAGMLEIIPNIGPVVSAIPAFIVAVTQTYFLGFSTIALYFIVQQLENNLIVPYIMKQATGLSPIIIMISLIIGGHVGGVLGVLLAIPIAICAETILSAEILRK